MKKSLIVLGVVVVLIVGSGIFIKMKGLDIVKNAAEKNATKILGARTTVGGLSVDIFQGRFKVLDFSIGQPKGFGETKSFSIDTFAIDLEPMTLFQKHAKINSIVLDKPALNLVMVGGKNNFTRLQENVAAFFPDEDSSLDMKLSIKELDLNNTRLRIDSDKYGSKEVTLADIHLKNIGVGSGGVAPKEAFRLAMDALKPQIAKALVKLGIKDEMTKVLEKEMGDKLKDLPAPVGDKLKETLGGLFNKKKKE